MKNVQIIDGATNSVVEIYSIPSSLSKILFPKEADIAFADDFGDKLQDIGKLLARPVHKKSVKAIHGT